MSSVYKSDYKWNNSREVILKILSFNNSQKGFIKYKVKTITLDNFTKKNKIKYIDILKIDVDGHEQQLLQGAKNTLKNNKVKTLLIEISAKKELFSKKEKGIINFLKKNNFVFIEKSNIFSVSLFSNTRSEDYLFVNKNYLGV